ncbi:MAG TPA: hypothetical protein VFR79_10285 [Nitrospira sp.]|nr:hypothetical protein [Nitrospira sp.]
MTHLKMRPVIGILLLFTLGACERQGPPPRPVGSATNKHVEETPAPPSRPNADAMIQNMKSPTEDAQQTEELLKGAADRTRQQSEPTIP